MNSPGENQPQLKRTLGPLMLWGLGVGYVISGNYFGWNLGLAEGGTLGLAIATFFVIIMYITFTFGYTELACAIPKAGGLFDYATKALGKKWGFSRNGQNYIKNPYSVLDATQKEIMVSNVFGRCLESEYFKRRLGKLDRLRHYYY